MKTAHLLIKIVPGYHRIGGCTDPPRIRAIGVFSEDCPTNTEGQMAWAELHRAQGATYEEARATVIAEANAWWPWIFKGIPAETGLKGGA